MLLRQRGRAVGRRRVESLWRATRERPPRTQVARLRQMSRCGRCAPHVGNSPWRKLRNSRVPYRCWARTSAWNSKLSWMLPHACDPASESLTTVARYHQRICTNPSNDGVVRWAERHRQGKIRRECCYYERATRLFNRFALIRWWWRSFTTGGIGRRSEGSGSVSQFSCSYSPEFLPLSNN